MKIAILGGGNFWRKWSAKYTEHDVVTPYGNPADNICIGQVGNHTLLTLQRHGRTYEHALMDIPWQANAFALGSFNPDMAIQVSACGTYRDDIEPGTLVLFDQIIDWTKNRPTTLGLPVFNKPTFINYARPVSTELTALAHKIFTDTQITHHMNGTLITEEGPRYSSLAESKMFKLLGADFINHSSSPELYFFRELNIPTLAISMVTNKIDLELSGDIEANDISASICKFKDTMPHAIKALINSLPASIPTHIAKTEAYDVTQFDLRNE